MAATSMCVFVHCGYSRRSGAHFKTKLDVRHGVLALLWRAKKGISILPLIHFPRTPLLHFDLAETDLVWSCLKPGTGTEKHGDGPMRVGLKSDRNKHSWDR